MDERIRRAQRGDRDAYAELVAEHYAPVYRFCARRIGPDAAEDAAQETFVTAQGSLRRYNGSSTLGTWLFGIANNVCRSLARRRKLEMNTMRAWSEPTTTPQESTLVNRETLRNALGKLSDEHREVVLMHEVEGLAYGEIAEVLAIPVGTVKSRLYHAFLQLRRHLGEGASA